MVREFIILASAEGGGGFNPLSFDPAALILSWITFLVALLLLTKVCWKPLLNAVREREERIANNIKSAESAKEEAEAMLKRYESQLADAKEDVSKLIEEGRTSAENLKKEILEKAKQQADSARDRANKEIGLATDRALEQIRTEAIDLSISVASRILERSLDDTDHRKLAEDILKEV